MTTHEQTSIIDILRWRARTQPGRLAYRFLSDGEFEESTLNYEDLDLRARSIAASLLTLAKPGDRALLIFPPGLDFIAAYFGCLYARVIAVPAYPPHPARLEKTIPVILGIVKDAAPTATLLTSSLFDAIASQKDVRSRFGHMKWLVTDGNEISEGANTWQEPAIDGDDMAFLQYTSGSTSNPRGVMVSHANLLHNLRIIEKGFGQSSEGHAVIWLPPYHDMGLVGGILQPLYSGYPATLIPHMLFLQKPLRWLQAISRFKATTSGGPNFAFDLCVRKIKPEQRDLLDLSSWEVAFNGAEKVYHKTLDQFSNYFAPSGFRREAFLPCYGLAEATLMVTGGPKGRIPRTRSLMGSGLGRNQVITPTIHEEETVTLVSCGQTGSEQKIVIVDLETLTPCPADQVGEIWVSGASVAKGYWNKASETAFSFEARLSDSHEGPYLRTGDLGFLSEGELYITGRLKDLIIQDGSNHYPQDIERTVEGCHSSLRPAGSAAFSISDAAGEQLVVVAETDHQIVVKADDIIKAIRKAVAEAHDIHVTDIVLTSAGGIPRTTSGKIKRYLCKANYLSGNLKETAAI